MYHVMYNTIVMIYSTVVIYDIVIMLPYIQLYTIYIYIMYSNEISCIIMISSTGMR